MSAIDGIYLSKNVRTKRVSSFDRTGGNKDRISLSPGEVRTIAEIGGPAVIRHIWLTLSSKDPMIRRNLILRMFWDGEESPSVEAPVGDFFGQGWGEEYLFVSLPLAAAPAGGRGLCCYFPMPFRKSARIELENQSDIELRGLYFYIDYEEDGPLPENAEYFHAWWNRELTEPEDGREQEFDEKGNEHKNISGDGNYLFTDAVGKGKFVGVNLYIDSPTARWPGEGDDLFLIDGERWPGSLHGTGTEDFFNMAWCPNERYTHPYFGCARIPGTIGWLGRTHYYRFFIEDPICFEKSLSASIEHGHANTLTLDLSSVAYWYQTEPHRPFPAFPPKELRQNMKPIGLEDIHSWRAAWRGERGGGALWGNEREK